MASVAYTFDTFIVSESSHEAFAAAVAVAEKPGSAHNPLFLYGRTGSGKSHLLHAIAHANRSHRRHANVLYLAAEAFIARLLHAIRVDEVGAFRRSITTVDVLLLDDLPRTLDRGHTQEGIFLILEESLMNGVQVVVASEMPPTDMRIVEQRSRPLFERALIVEVGYPDQVARFEIARRAAEMRGVALSDDALRYLAERLTGSPREIQSVIARIAAESALSGANLDMTLVARVVGLHAVQVST